MEDCTIPLVPDANDVGAGGSSSVGQWMPSRGRRRGRAGHVQGTLAEAARCASAGAKRQRRWERSSLAEAAKQAGARTLRPRQ